MISKMNDLIKKVDTEQYMKIPISHWRNLLSKECQVYVFGENYIAKRFDQINYKYCNKNEAKDILIDNLYAILRYKYFPSISDETDNKIKEIVNSVTQNLKTTLIKVSYDNDSDCEKIAFLPSYCIAFRNGVYDFWNNLWFFKYDIINLDNISNKLYIYNPKYTIMWYIDIDFEPLSLNIFNINSTDLLTYFKHQNSQHTNYCFELIYNMCHNVDNVFEMDKFNHLCEILGYTILQEFSQNFILFVGSGQNGKNSLFDGCFTHKIIPRPSQNDLQSIEEDRFITGSLENKSHNIFLESSAKTYTESKMLKALTGSMYQTIEQKGIDKYSSIINCKYIFAANDQDKIKFSDNTPGFKRRINVFEVFYKWDSKGRYLNYGDYYNVSFSDSLSELKNDNNNIITFIYLGMFGIYNATKGFTRNFKFDYNDWKLTYSDMDISLKEKLEKISLREIVHYMTSSDKRYDECKPLLFDISKKRLYQSYSFISCGYKGEYEDMIDMLKSMEESTAYFSENDVYINLRILQNIINDKTPSIVFTQNIKKIYDINKFVSLYNNQPYLKAAFINDKLKVRK